jgi:hypothetical protein
MAGMHASAGNPPSVATPVRSRLRRAATVVGLVIASLLTALVALEILIRLTGLGVHDYMQTTQMYARLLVPDEGGYLRHPPGQSIPLGGVILRFNSLGMRDVEPRIPKPPGTFRVLFLGDSVTLGPKVPLELTFPGRLRTMLGPGVDVVIGAVAGWNTVAESRFLARHIDTLAPDLIVLTYVVNDNEPTEPFRRTREQPKRWTTRLYRALVLRSRLAEWAAFVYQARFERADAYGLKRYMAWNRKKTAFGEPFAPDDRGWHASRAALRRIDGLARQHGARFVIFLQRLERPIDLNALARLQEFSRDSGVPVYDTLPFIAGYNPVALMNDGFIDPHWNPKGHELFANGFARTLTAEGLLPPAH